MTVATRIAVMNEGRIVQVGTPAEVYERPRSRFVASFVGDVTLLEARVVGRDGPWLGLRAVETGTTVRVSAGYGLTAGQTVWVALRPEQLAIAAAPPAEPHVNALAGAVEDVAYRGDASILHVRLAGGGTMRASRPGRGGPAAMSGARVWLTWTPDAAVVLEE